MCNCIKQTEAKIMEKFRREVGHREILTGGFDHEALVRVNRGMHQRVAMPFTIKFIKAAETGELQKKTLTQHVFPSYCSLCGAKLNYREGVE